MRRVWRSWRRGSLAPPLVDRIFGARAQRNHFVDDLAAPPTRGNVFAPDPGWRTASGDWPTVERSRARLMLPLAAAVATGLALRLRRA